MNRKRSARLARCLSPLLCLVLAALACSLPGYEASSPLIANEIETVILPGTPVTPADEQPMEMTDTPAGFTNDTIVTTEGAIVHVTAVVDETETPKAQLPVLKNPGFEDGFNFWSELPGALQYGGQSVDEDVVAYTGGHSRKLFLRYGGSYIIQRMPLDPPLPVDSLLTLSVSVRMPYGGTPSNKIFQLELVAGDAGSRQMKTTAEFPGPYPDWTPLMITLTITDFPASWVEVHAMTNHGDGLYKNFDRPVYVDDFTLVIDLP